MKPDDLRNILEYYVEFLRTVGDEFDVYLESTGADPCIKVYCDADSD